MALRSESLSLHVTPPEKQRSEIIYFCSDAGGGRGAVSHGRQLSLLQGNQTPSAPAGLRLVGRPLPPRPHCCDCCHRQAPLPPTHVPPGPAEISLSVCSTRGRWLRSGCLPRPGQQGLMPPWPSVPFLPLSCGRGFLGVGAREGGCGWEGVGGPPTPRPGSHRCLWSPRCRSSSGFGGSQGIRTTSVTLLQCLINRLRRASRTKWFRGLPPGRARLPARQSRGH